MAKTNTKTTTSSKGTISLGYKAKSASATQVRKLYEQIMLAGVHALRNNSGTDPKLLEALTDVQAGAIKVTKQS